MWTAPADLNRITIKPTQEWEAKFANGLAYAAYTDNHHLRHVLYMYEEGSRDAACPVVEISYSVNFGNSLVKKGVVNVELNDPNKKSEFFPSRNTLYTIVLGGNEEGLPTPLAPNEGELTAKLEVVDWANGEVIDGTINPNSGLLHALKYNLSGKTVADFKTTTTEENPDNSDKLMISERFYSVSVAFNQNAKIEKNGRMCRLRFSSGTSFAIDTQSILRRASICSSFSVFDRRYLHIEKSLSIYQFIFSRI